MIDGVILRGVLSSGDPRFAALVGSEEAPFTVFPLSWVSIEE